MDARQVLVAAVVLALICWLSLAAVITSFSPESGVLVAFYVLALLAIGATLLPVVYYLHLRFGSASERPRWGRYIRQSLWVGILLSFYLWLSSLRALTVPAALLSLCIVALIELVVLRPAKQEP
jgi:hypothetical protein